MRWLEQAGLIVKVPRVGKPGMPLKAYRDQGWMRNIPLYAIGSLDNWA